MTNPLEIGRGPQPTLHVIEGALQGKSIPLKAPETKLGREGGDLDLSLYTQMSRMHSRIFVENGVWNIQDLGSTNGTHVNGERVVSRRLQDGDVLKMGNFSARISLPGQPRTVAATGPALTQVAPDIAPMPPPTQRLPHQPPQAPPANPWPTQGPPQVPPQAYPPPAAYPPPQQYPAPIPGPHYYPPPAPVATDSGLSTTGQTLSTVALCLMCVGLFPCLGWLNWAAIPLGGISAILSLISLITDQNSATRNTAVIGLVMGLIAVVVGTFRLILGAGLC